MAQGTVKFFSAGRGYGFINPAQGGEDFEIMVIRGTT